MTRDWKMTASLWFWAIAIIALVQPRGASGQDWIRGEVGLELRGFAQDSAFPGQDDLAASVAWSPELFFDWAGGSQSLVLSPFVRLDAGDVERTHFDLREAYWLWAGQRFEVKTGLARVFWGVTESQHLVDVINQTDGIESPDGEDKLGQPMVQLTWIPDWGTVDLFVLPGFRERTFPGTAGRFRAPLPVAASNGIRHDRIDLAARVFRTIGMVDLGVTGFWGTSREPRFRFAPTGAALLSSYPTIRQIGVDAQYTRGSWLFKSEGLVRGGTGSTFFATVAGFEYTWGDVRRSGIDVGLLGEFHYDGRDADSFGEADFWSTPFRDDLFGGIRVALNDVQSTELLGGTIIDRRTGETAVFLEGSRRIGDRMRAELEVRSFHWTDPSGPFHSLREDDFVQLGLTYYF